MLTMTMRKLISKLQVQLLASFLYFVFATQFWPKSPEKWRASMSIDGRPYFFVSFSAMSFWSGDARPVQLPVYRRMSGRLWFPLSASGGEACEEPQRRRTWQSPWWRHQTALTGGTEGIAVPPFRTFCIYFIRQFLFYPILSFLLTFKADYLDKSFLELKAFPVERWTWSSGCLTLTQCLYVRQCVVCGGH